MSDVEDERPEEPELSVVIPAFDAVATLPEQLAALEAQIPQWPWEVLVCDNGSTDGTAELVRSWTGRIPGLRLVDASARRGPAAARNIGVSHATSGAIAFCDADDVVGDGWVAAMRDAIDAHGFVAGSFEFDRLNGSGSMIASWTTQTHGLTTKPFLPGISVAGSGNMGVSRAVFEEVGGFFEGVRTAEDDDFCLRVQLAGHPLVFAPDAVLHVRRRESVRALFRQAFSYAAGERRLAERYREYLAARPLGESDASRPPVAAPPHLVGEAVTPLRRALALGARAGALLRRGARKAVSLRRPGDLAPLAWRWGWRLGWRFGRPDPGIPILVPSRPDTLRGDYRPS